MDLRVFSPSKAQVALAKRLSVQGLLGYQPFVFDEDFEVGVGYEFAVGKREGLVLYPDIDPHQVKASPELARLIVDPAKKYAFRQGNANLRLLYDYLARVLADAVGGAAGASFLDVGCNTGYFPLTFARLGSTKAFGCDRQDFTPTFGLLKEILGVDAQFIESRYDVNVRTISGIGAADAVLSMMVLCHISSPLSYLTAMAKLSKKAILILTMVNTDNHYSITFGEPRGDYAEDHFPNCFDNLVCPSRPLLRRSLELLGYSKVTELDLAASGAPLMSWDGRPFCAYLGVR